MARIDAFFKLMHEHGASDLHLTAGQPPALRIHGDIERVKYKVLDSDELRSMLYEICTEDKIKVFEETGDIDFGYEIPGLARYRANFFMQKYGVAAVFREIPSQIMTAEQLALPPVISKLSSLPRGLVVVTGPTGSGKSTTLAAIIDQANRTRTDHIITIEDPIEFVHNSQGCLVNHREIGVHTKSFTAALRGALQLAGPADRGCDEYSQGKEDHDQPDQKQGNLPSQERNRDEHQQDHRILQNQQGNRAAEEIADGFELTEA